MFHPRVQNAASDKLLLEEQERFMSSQGRIKPAARLIRSTAPPTIESTTNKKTQRDVISLNNTIPGTTTTTNQTDKPPRAPSQFRSQRNTAAPLPSTTSKSSTSSKPDHFDSAGVISKVLEREYGSNALSPKTYVPPTFTQSTGTTGFPETFKTSKDKPSRFRRTTKKEKKQRSVFASMMADARKKAAEEEETKETKRAFSSGFNTPQEDALEIHQENTTRIAGMSMNEINDAKKDLMKTLSPDAIAILMKRRNQKKAQKKKNNNRTQTQPTTLSSSIDNSIINVSELKNETDLLNVARDSRRTVLDRAKLDWTKDVAVPTSTANQMHTEIRFDLDGDVIAPNDDPQQLLGLHHHGRNPTSAGYAIDELLHLSRSTHDAQRTMALRTITKILQKRAQALISRTKDVVLPLALPSETHVVLLMSLQYVAYNPKSTTMREHAVSSLQAWLVPFNDDTARKKLETVWSSSKLGHVVMPPTLHAQHENLLQPSCRLDTDSHPNEELNWNFNANNNNNNNNNNNDKVNIEEELTKEEMDEKREEESKQGALRPVYWLLKRGLLKYIARILKICHLEKDSATFIKCLSILSFCARHSIMASSIIVNQSNVVLVLREVVFENYMDPICVPESLSFLRLLCSSNVDVVEKFCNDKLFIVIHKYILMKKNDDNDGGGGNGEVVNECLKIIRICIEYGINVMESIRVLMEFDQIQSTKSTKSTTTTSTTTTTASTTASIELTRMHLVETICRHVNMNEKAQR